MGVVSFILTNYSLEFTSNFYIGLYIDQLFIKVDILGWSLLESHVFVMKIACLNSEFYHYLSMIHICTNIEKTVYLLGHILENSLENISCWNMSL